MKENVIQWPFLARGKYSLKTVFSPFKCWIFCYKLRSVSKMKLCNVSKTSSQFYSIHNFKNYLFNKRFYFVIYLESFNLFLLVTWNIIHFKNYYIIKYFTNNKPFKIRKILFSLLSPFFFTYKVITLVEKHWYWYRLVLCF